MKTKINRRNFLLKSSQACIGCCAMILLPKLNASAAEIMINPEEEPINPKTLNYCGYKCPADCKFLKGTIENNSELKKEAYKLWKIEERFGVEFNDDTIFCFGCKTLDKPEGIVLRNCTVRSCAREKGYDSCIECKELTECQKELWDRFPDFKNAVIGMQTKYFETVTAE